MPLNPFRWKSLFKKSVAAVVISRRLLTGVFLED